MNSHGCEHCGHSFPSCQCRSDLHGNFQDFGNPFEMGGPGPMGPNSHPINTNMGNSGTRTPNEPQNPVQMWQDQHYLGPESGFISGATTTRSSRTGHDLDNISEGGFLSGMHKLQLISRNFLKHLFYLC